jgi:hypothetical protein
MMMNWKFRENSAKTKRCCIEDNKKKTNNDTLRNTIQKLKNRRPRIFNYLSTPLYATAFSGDALPSFLADD